MPDLFELPMAGIITMITNPFRLRRSVGWGCGLSAMFGLLGFDYGGAGPDPEWNAEGCERFTLCLVTNRLILSIFKTDRYT